MKKFNIIATLLFVFCQHALAETATPGQRHDLREASREAKHDIREASRSNRIDNVQGKYQGDAGKAVLIEGDRGSRQYNRNDRQYGREVNQNNRQYDRYTDSAQKDSQRHYANEHQEERVDRRIERQGKMAFN